jgi:hypothetical protein
MMLPVPTARGDPREEFPAKRTFEKWPPILRMPFTGVDRKDPAKPVRLSGRRHQLEHGHELFQG